MNTFTFTKATRKQAKARVAIDGPSGSGKTFTSLVLATQLANGGKIAVLDTERGSASLYSDKFDFDVLELYEFSPAVYTKAISLAHEAGYKVLVIDSLTHAWEGEGGALDQVDAKATRMQGNSYAAWKDVTPLHRRMVDAILQSEMHIIATMRSKMDYVQEKDERGKTIIRKVGMAPIQRQGMEYEFTLVADMDIEHHISISKSRCEFMADKTAHKPGADFWKPFVAWLNSGDTPVPAAPKAIEKAQAQASDAPMNGKPRPYAPEVLKEKVLDFADKLSGVAVKGNEAQMIAMNLDECFGGNADKRHALMFYLTKHESTKDLDNGWLLALKKWINVQNVDGKWFMDPMAVAEANLAYERALIESGQMPLPQEGA